MHAFLSNLANTDRQTDKQTRAKHVRPFFVGGNKDCVAEKEEDGTE